VLLFVLVCCCSIGTSSLSQCKVKITCPDDGVGVENDLVVKANLQGRTANVMIQLMYADLYREYVGARGVVAGVTSQDQVHILKRLKRAFGIELCGTEVVNERMPDFIDCPYISPPQHTPYHQNYMFYSGETRVRIREKLLSNVPSSFQPKQVPSPSDVVIHYRKYSSSSSLQIPELYFETILNDLERRRGLFGRRKDYNVYYITEPEVHASSNDALLLFLRTRFGAMPFQGQSEIEDMLFAIQAGTIILTEGTFSWMIGFLSEFTYQRIHVPFRSTKQRSKWYPDARLFVHDDPRYVYHDLDAEILSFQTPSHVLNSNSYFTRVIKRRPHGVPWLRLGVDKKKNRKQKTNAETIICDFPSSLKIIVNKESRVEIVKGEHEEKEEHCVPHTVREFCYDTFHAAMISYCTRFITSATIAKKMISSSLSNKHDLESFRKLQICNHHDRDCRVRYLKYLTSSPKARKVEWRLQNTATNISSSVSKQFISYDCNTLPEISPYLHIHGLVRSALYPFESMISSVCPLMSSLAPPPFPRMLEKEEGGKKQEDYVVISWYTSNYEDKALRLLESCEKFEIQCVLYEIKEPYVISLSKFENVTIPKSNLVIMKPWFLLYAMRVLQPGRNLLYVDIDMVFRSKPKFVLSQNYQVDMMMYDFNQEFSIPNLPYSIVTPSSVLYLHPSSRTQAFVSEWASTTIYNPFAPDDHLFDYTMEFSTCEWRSILKIHWLSKAHVRYQSLKHFNDVKLDEIIIDHPDEINMHSTQVFDMIVPAWSKENRSVVGYVRILKME